MGDKNRPNPLELIVLNESLGEKKSEYVPDQTLDNAGTFIIVKEDHTYGNMIVQFVLPCNSDNRSLLSSQRIAVQQGCSICRLPNSSPS